MTTHALECNGIFVTRVSSGGNERHLLDDVNARFEGGAMALVRGRVGAGKSTLIHVLGGLLRPTSGTVSADGEPISRWVAAHRDRWRRRVGIALQSPHLIADRSALRNVVLPLVPRAGSLAEIERTGRAQLTALSLEAAAERPVRELSGGERQRLALARALVSEPDFVLADEPFAHQDDPGAELALEALSRAATRGAVVVIASHDRRLAEPEIGRASYRLEDGRLEQVS